MLTFSASQAKQNFGALMGHLAQSPVAIERHQKIVAIVMSPEAAAATPSLQQAARTQQQQRELQRLMRHQQWAIALLCAEPATQQLHLEAARSVVQRWQAEQLCSADYIERWQNWLALPVTELAQRMCSDSEGWGPAMRQNSPFATNPP
ncbi:MAG: hypothetical protein AUJ20_04045 [Comamonadaceae bacterium CG1_02_60_18]|nr:MAG: hypothetical protein AUJ20_04045 [Comamonadaceae bacterium CG1_02_60_18]PIQ51846.1 MAG: prevent-host-death protein [Comamonadaceae bacterium CG12_big_fil_rev_8_21_14_0_65_59_15]